MRPDDRGDAAHPRHRPLGEGPGVVLVGLDGHQVGADMAGGDELAAVVAAPDLTAEPAGLEAGGAGAVDGEDVDDRVTTRKGQERLEVGRPQRSDPVSRHRHGGSLRGVSPRSRRMLNLGFEHAPSRSRARDGRPARSSGIPAADAAAAPNPCRQQWRTSTQLHGENGNPDGSGASQPAPGRWETYYDAGRPAGPGGHRGRLRQRSARSPQAWDGLERLMYGLHRARLPVPAAHRERRSAPLPRVHRAQPGPPDHARLQVPARAGTPGQRATWPRSVAARPAVATFGGPRSPATCATSAPRPREQARDEGPGLGADHPRRRADEE